MIKSRTGKIAFLGIAVLVGVGFSWGPWQAFFKQRADADKAQETAQQDKSKWADLTRQKALGETPLGRETTARKKGFAEPGEESL